MKAHNICFAVIMSVSHSKSQTPLSDNTHNNYIAKTDSKNSEYKHRESNNNTMKNYHSQKKPAKRKKANIILLTQCYMSISSIKLERIYRFSVLLTLRFFPSRCSGMQPWDITAFLF